MLKNGTHSTQILGRTDGRARTLLDHRKHFDRTSMMMRVYFNTFCIRITAPNIPIWLLLFVLGRLQFTLKHETLPRRRHHHRRPISIYSLEMQIKLSKLYTFFGYQNVHTHNFRQFSCSKVSIWIRKRCSRYVSQLCKLRTTTTTSTTSTLSFHSFHSLIFIVATSRILHAFSFNT